MSLSIEALVGRFGFDGPLRLYVSLYGAVSQREREKEERNARGEEEMSKQSSSAPAANIVGPFPTINQI